MFEVNCYDVFGKLLTHFTQWDINQKLVIPMEDCYAEALTMLPEVHFSNESSYRAIIEVPIVNKDTNTLTVSVPNTLLRDSLPIIGYIYLAPIDDVSAQKTVASFKIPVRPRIKPSEYEYEEDFNEESDILTVEELKTYLQI